MNETRDVERLDVMFAIKTGILNAGADTDSERAGASWLSHLHALNASAECIHVKAGVTPLQDGIQFYLRSYWGQW